MLYCLALNHTLKTRRERIMTTWDLSGQGAEALTTGTTQLFAHVTSFPPGWSAGDAYPVNYFRIGAIRFSVGDYSYHPIYFDAEQMVIDVPPTATGFSFVVNESGVVRVAEGGPPAPPGMSITTTPLDGSYVNGNNVEIAWSGIDEPLADDYLVIVPASTASGDGDMSVWCFGSTGYVFAGTCDTSLPSGPLSGDGACTKIFLQNVPVGTLCNARYRRNDGDIDVLVSASFVTGE